MEQAILSIQSFVSFGHVGNRAACWALQQLGLEVWPVPTVWFAHHPGYGPPAGSRFPSDWLNDLLQGLLEVVVPQRCAGVLSGYLGSATQARVLLDALNRLREASGRCLYLCDPVLGEEGKGLFVAPEVAETFRDLLVPAADIVTPNAFELGWLTAHPVTDAASARVAARLLRGRGPGTVVVTSVPAADAERIGIVLDCAAGCFRIETPRLDCRAHGCGDLFSALYLGHLVRGFEPVDALEAAVSILFFVVERTVRERGTELCLPSCRELQALARPRFRAIRLESEPPMRAT